MNILKSYMRCRTYIYFLTNGRYFTDDLVSKVLGTCSCCGIRTFAPFKQSVDHKHITTISGEDETQSTSSWVWLPVSYVRYVWQMFPWLVGQLMGFLRCKNKNSEIEQLRREVHDKQKEISNLEKKMSDLEMEKQEALKSGKVKDQRIEQNKTEISSLKEEIEEFSKRCTTKNSEIEHLKREVYNKHIEISDLEEKMSNLEMEKQDALRRFSELVSVKLRDNNPNIVDLSDDCRPTKLAEMFSELYDNEWTNAFSVLETKLSENQSIEVLLDIVMEAYEFCDVMVKEKWQEMESWFLDMTIPGSEQTVKWLKDSFKVKLKDNNDKAAMDYKNTLRKICENQTIEELLSRDSTLEKYTDLCVRLCLLMVSTDPAVVIFCPGWESSLKAFDRSDVIGVKQPETKLDLDGSVSSQGNLAQSVKEKETDDEDNEEEHAPIKEDNSETVAENNENIMSSLTQNTTNQQPCEEKTDNENHKTITDDVPIATEQDIVNDSVGASENVEKPTEDKDSKLLEKTNQDMNAGDSETKDKNLYKEEMNLNTPTKNGESPMNTKNIDDSTLQEVKRSLFRKDIFKEYTKRGEYLDFVVWPAMYLHRDGPLLSKGVAQGSREEWTNKEDTTRFWGERKPKTKQ